MPRDPSSGNRPILPPYFLFLVLKAFSYEPMGPVPLQRPNANSPDNPTFLPK